MNTTPEEWRPIPGYEGHYEASPLGQVRSLKRSTPHVMKPQWNAQIGKWALVLSMDGKPRNTYVHTLVTSAFHGPRPEGMWACHNNDDSHDNRAENLRWDTPEGNHRDMIDAGNHHYGKRTHCKHGHEYTLENTEYHRATGDRYVNSSVYRRCLKCRQIYNAKGARARKASTGLP